MRAFILTLFILVFQTSAKTLVVADVDNTIKRTGGKSIKRVLLKKARGEDTAYETVKKLFQSLYINEKADFLYLSLSFEELTPIRKWLAKHEFPPGRIAQRNVNSLLDPKKFKKTKLKESLERYDLTNAKVLFWGDNLEYDPEVYAEVAKELEINDFEIYIRDVTGENTFWGGDVFMRPAQDHKVFLADWELFDLARFPEFFRNLNYFSGPSLARLDEGSDVFFRLRDRLAVKLYYSYCLQDRTRTCKEKVKKRVLSLLDQKGLKR